MKDIVISIDQLDALVFDFDGVLTNNKVHLDQSGIEWVSCSRADGLGFDVLRKLNFPSYVLSTENNPVVKARAEKLKIPVLQGVGNKLEVLKRLMSIQRSRHNKIHTHWTNYSRDWFESDLWDSWFRVLLLARVDVHFNKKNFKKWGFINYPGIGYHHLFKEENIF